MKQIINNLRTWLIHKLGGITAKESKQSNFNSFNIGYYVVCRNHLDFADSLYGLPAEEWCQKMYERLKYDFNTKNPQQ